MCVRSRVLLSPPVLVCTDLPPRIGRWAPRDSQVLTRPGSHDGGRGRRPLEVVGSLSKRQQSERDSVCCEEGQETELVLRSV